MRIVFAMLAALVICQAAEAQSVKQLTLPMTGTVSCETWNTSHHGNPALAADEDRRVVAYVAAYSRWDNHNVADGLPDSALTDAVSSFCSVHPLLSEQEAVEEMIYQLEQRGVSQ